ncbi:hypothetical protein SAY86_029549 [Trapa natans]|uniref:Uncharacterized protein n=1 Tax=Trapa natans TaxID=22666 RepID=A0AAN7RHG1_TRANT|nr:hypothetical protein SAY86_029549 [Trapa natans]
MGFPFAAKIVKGGEAAAPQQRFSLNPQLSEEEERKTLEELKTTIAACLPPLPRSDCPSFSSALLSLLCFCSLLGCQRCRSSLFDCALYRCGWTVLNFSRILDHLRCNCPASSALSFIVSLPPKEVYPRLAPSETVSI